MNGYTVLPLKRRNQSLRYVEDPNGNVWTVNRHGVVTRHEPDFLEGWAKEITPDRMTEAHILSTLMQDESWGCKCCRIERSIIASRIESDNWHKQAIRFGESA